MTDYSSAEKFILDKIEKELPKNLTYHGLHHTQDVLNAAMQIAAQEGVTDEEELKLLRMAIMFHDAGFIHVYKGHEVKGCEMSKEILPQFGFDEEQIKKICGMIMTTQIPQEPHTQLERIIADADLDYLGRDDFYSIGKTLFDEFKIYLNVKDEAEWNRIQINFLSHHQYHTPYCVRLREPQKQLRLQEIKSLANS